MTILSKEQAAVLGGILEPFIDIIVEKVAVKVKEMASAREPRYYTRREVCEVLGITLPTLHDYTKRGDLQAFKMNGRVLYDAWAVDDAVRTHSLYKGKRKETAK